MRHRAAIAIRKLAVGVIRVPGWVERPLGRYYMYFAHHGGLFIRLAYADSLRGPWKIHEPGVLKVEDTAFYRPQPDPVDSPPGAYTHVASPEVYVDESRRRIVLWVHGVWTEGQRWPEPRADAAAWMRQRGYAQFTQAAESGDGLTFRSRGSGGSVPSPTCSPRKHPMSAWTWPTSHQRSERSIARHDSFAILRSFARTAGRTSSTPSAGSKASPGRS